MSSLPKILDSIAALNDEDFDNLLGQLPLLASLRPWVDPGASADPLALPGVTAPIPVAPRSAEGVDVVPVSGCPWCRRPVCIDVARRAPFASPELPRSPRVAYVTLLYGPECFNYFLHAIVLGHNLAMLERRKPFDGGAPPRRILMHTSDVPCRYVDALSQLGWETVKVEYIRRADLAPRLFRGRFDDLFTKLRIFELPDLDLVLYLDNDILVRTDGEPLSDLFKLRAPAAMIRGVRGKPSPVHGEKVSYCSIWGGADHRALIESDFKVPIHEQTNGINAGVLLVKPDAEVFARMMSELKDFVHPEHSCSNMPDQEYLGRFFGTFDTWTHMDCRFNFEVRGYWPTWADGSDDATPYDFSTSHQQIRTAGHPGAVVLHFSGHWSKPTAMLYDSNMGPTKGRLLVTQTWGHTGLLKRFRTGGPNLIKHFKTERGYGDTNLLWDAILEWHEQLNVALCDLFERAGIDALNLATPISQAPNETAHGGTSKILLCKFWMKGKCTANASCEFAHSAEEQQAACARVPCKFFMETGVCRQGSECRFAHAESYGVQPLSEAATVEPCASIVGNRSSDEGKQKNNASSDLSVPLHSLGRQHANKKTTLCSFWLRNRCSKAADCTFAHCPIMQAASEAAEGLLSLTSGGDEACPEDFDLN